MESVKNKYVILIHGGATNLTFFNEKSRSVYIYQLKRVLIKAKQILLNGGFAIDAVVQAVKDLEDCELFNAGKGAALNEIGETRLEASLMEGEFNHFGCILDTKHIKNPILLCEKILKEQQKLILCGEGAEIFAKKNDLDLVKNSYFITSSRQKYWKNNQKEKFGTVGAVAIDIYGNLCAGTSTGGMPNKIIGRIGDSGLIGKGTFADNKTCAISCTGDGEYFSQIDAAYKVASLIELKKLSLNDAIKTVLEEIKTSGGQGGIIGIDNIGNYHFQFTTKGMYRGIVSNKEIRIEIE